MALSFLIETLTVLSFRCHPFSSRFRFTLIKSLPIFSVNPKCPFLLLISHLTNLSLSEFTSSTLCTSSCYSSVSGASPLSDFQMPKNNIFMSADSFNFQIIPSATTMIRHQANRFRKTWIYLFANTSPIYIYIYIFRYL